MLLRNAAFHKFYRFSTKTRQSLNGNCVKIEENVLCSLLVCITNCLTASQWCLMAKISNKNAGQRPSVLADFKHEIDENTLCKLDRAVKLMNKEFSHST